MPGDTWCTWSKNRTRDCPDHQTEGHGEVVSQLGGADEPQSNGTPVIVWPGDYRRQEVWVASGANIGNWYCLGNEFGRPRTWEDPRTYAETVMSLKPAPRMPAHLIPMHPVWSDVLDRGPVFLLSHDNTTAYRTGWRNGRRRLYEEIESLAEDDTGADK